MLPGLLEPAQAQSLARQASENPTLPPMSLAQTAHGRGDLFFFDPTLPPALAAWREAFYQCLVPIANRWNAMLGIDCRYPTALETYLHSNRAAGQTKSLSHLSRLDMSGYQALHQYCEGKHVFPLQVVVLLSRPGQDFTGGEFVMTEQRPRMQSRPMVLSMQQGDAAIISTALRPVKGSKGFYRVNIRNAISPVRSGVRAGLALFFHNAP